MSCKGFSNIGLIKTRKRIQAVHLVCHYVSQLPGTSISRRFLSFIQVNRFTPMPSILFTSSVAIILTVLGDLSTLIDLYGFCVWVEYGAMIATVLILRYTEPNLRRPYKVPIFIPIIVLVMSLYLVVAPIIQTGRIQFLYAVIFMCCGLIIYFPFIHWKFKIPYMNKVYRSLQMLMQVVPPPKTDRKIT